jgi:hypothetical protein
MPYPNLTAPVIRRLLQLDTPVARRILELGLFLGFAYGLGWVLEHGNHFARIIAGFMMIPCIFAGVIMAFSLIAAVGSSAQESTSQDKDGKK